MTGPDDDPDWQSFDVPSISWRRVALVGVIVVGLGITVARLLFAVGDEDSDDARSTSPTDEAGHVVTDPSVLLPQIDDLIDGAELPAGPPGGLAIGDQGNTVVADRFDATKHEGTFAAIILNPHQGWQAESVEVRSDLVAEDGTVIDTSTALLDVVRPGQTVAVAGLIVDVGDRSSATLSSTVRVARWREVAAAAGAIEVADVETRAAPLTGITTTMTARSTFDQPAENIVVVAVYRRSDGSIIGGFDAVVDRIDPGQQVDVSIDLPTNIDAAEIASTEVYTTGGPDV